MISGQLSKLDTPPEHFCLIQQTSSIGIKRLEKKKSSDLPYLELGELNQFPFRVMRMSDPTG